MKSHNKSTKDMQHYNTDIPLPENIVISVFKSSKAKYAYDFTLQKFINTIIGRGDQRYIEPIIKLRSIDKVTDKDRYDEIKKHLCAFTLSCRCTPGGSRTQHPDHNNGILCVDIDAKENPHLHNWEKVRDALGALKYCYMSALSAGGKGVFVVMAVDSQTPHEQSFAAVKTFFLERLHIVIDNSCKDIARLRFISYDPNAVVKQPTEIFKTIIAIKPIDTRHPQRTRTDISHNSDEYDRVRAAVSVWVRKRIALDNYDDWTKAAAALKQLPDGHQLLDMVSQYGSTYKGEADTQRKFERVKNMQSINVASFFYLCRQYGISNDEINAELRALRGTTSTMRTEQPTIRHVPAPADLPRATATTEPTTAPTTPTATEPPTAWTADTAPPTPIAPGETEEQARANNASILNQALFVDDLLKGVYKFTPPTPEQIELLDPNREAPQFAPF